MHDLAWSHVRIGAAVLDSENGWCVVIERDGFVYRMPESYVDQDEAIEAAKRLAREHRAWLAEQGIAYSDEDPYS